MGLAETEAGADPCSGWAPAAGAQPPKRPGAAVADPGYRVRHMPGRARERQDGALSAKDTLLLREFRMARNGYFGG